MDARSAASAPRISVVVPVYNVEDYLAWCLDSLLAQDLPSFEAILVNDGSPDGSRAIAQRYADADARFKIVDKENGGLSSARNAGIAAAKAPIVAFLDSDDRFTPDACRVIVEAFERTHADVVTFGANAYPAESAYPWLTHVLSPRDCVYDAYSSDILFKESSRPFAWRTACRRDFLLEHGIAFDESVRYGEDQVFDFAIYPRAAITAFISNKLYDYRVARKGSLMDTMRSNDETRLLEHVKIFQAIVNDWQRDDLIDVHADDLAFFLCDFVLYDALRLLGSAAPHVFEATGTMLESCGALDALQHAKKADAVAHMVSFAGPDVRSLNAVQRGSLMFNFDVLRFGRKGALRRAVANVVGKQV